MGAQTRQQGCVCQKEEGPGWVAEDKITNLTSEEHCQMTLASGKSGKVYVDRCQVSSRVELKSEPQPNKKKKNKEARQKYSGPTSYVTTTCLLALQNMLTSSKVKPNPVGGGDNQMEELAVLQTILIFNIRPSQQLKGSREKKNKNTVAALPLSATVPPPPQAHQPLIRHNSM